METSKSYLSKEKERFIRSSIPIITWEISALARNHKRRIGISSLNRLKILKGLKTIWIRIQRSRLYKLQYQNSIRKISITQSSILIKRSRSSIYTLGYLRYWEQGMVGRSMPQKFCYKGMRCWSSRRRWLSL